MESKFQKNAWIVSSTISVIYFISLLKYYSVGYVVPDYYLYTTFGDSNLPAKDGFSSLFLKIMSFGVGDPYVLHILSLVLLAISLFSFIYFFLKISQSSGLLSIIGIIGIISSGFWYYIYGKLVYDFPFTTATYGISLLVFHKFLESKKPIYLNMTSLLLGLCLSWKPYNLFIVIGFVGLACLSEITKGTLLEQLKSNKKKLLIFLFFVCGYLIGNYRLLDDTFYTIVGLRAYPAHSSLYDFLFVNNWVIWDHINSLSFNSSTMLVVTAIYIMFILPIYTNNKKILLFSICNTMLFALFIIFFSPGYPWHGFPLGVFILTSFIFNFSNVRQMNLNKFIFLLTVVIILMQTINNFMFYLPKQNYWHKITNMAIKDFETHSDDVADNVNNIIGNLDGGFKIDGMIKRYKLVDRKQPEKLDFKAYGPRFDNFANKVSNKLGIVFPENNYEMYSGYIKMDPLEYSNQSVWNEIYTNENYDDLKPKYIINILPKAFFQISDVVELNPYKNQKLKYIQNSEKYIIKVYEVVK